MKNKIPYVVALLAIALTFGSIARAAQPAFTSPQVGTSPANGFVLQTNGLNSTWVATSTLGIGVTGVLSFNTRTGAVTLSSGDVTTALGFTPFGGTNPLPIANGGTATTTFYDKGITFYNSTLGTVSQAGNGNFVYDYTNNRLGVGTSSPTEPFQVQGATNTANFDGSRLYVSSGGTGSTGAGAAIITAGTGNYGITLNGPTGSTASLEWASGSGRQLVFGNSSLSAAVTDSIFLGVPTGTDTTKVAINGSATSTPWALLSVAGSAGGTVPLFNLSTSTSGFATTSAFIVSSNGQLGLGGNELTPTNDLTFSNLSNDIAFYNTADQTTNFELGSLGWAANVLNFGTTKGGTGTSRVTRISAVSRQFNVTDSAAGPDFTITSTSNYGTSNNIFLSIADGSADTGSSGTNIIERLDPTINQTLTAGYTVLQIKPTETATGSGIKLLAQFGTSTNPDLFDVDNTGLASTTSFLIGGLRGNAAGSFIAVDPTGKVIATTTPSGGVTTSLAQTYGTAQTGALTLATTSASFNGLTVADAITNSGGTFTITPLWSGSLNISGGGTGTTTPGVTNGVEFNNGTLLTNDSGLTYAGAGGAITATGPITAASFSPTSSTVPVNGLYLSAANTLNFSTNSSPRLSITTVQINANLPVTGAASGFELISGNTSGTVPSLIANRAVTTAGIGADASNQLSLITNSLTRLEILSGGNVGIGTTSPYAPFSVGGNMVIGASTAGGTNGTLTIAGLTTGILHSSVVGLITSSLVSLTADISGILPVANGGTSFGTYTIGDILYASGTGALTKLGIGGTGNVLTVAGGVPTWAAPVAAIPAPVFATTTTAVYTATPSTVFSATIPGGTINTTNGIKGDFYFEWDTNTTSTKTVSLTYGGTLCANSNTDTPTGSTSIAYKGWVHFDIRDNGSTSAQTCALTVTGFKDEINVTAGVAPLSFGVVGTAAKDSTASQTLVFTITQQGVGADVFTMGPGSITVQ